MERAEQWYTHTIGSMSCDWEELQVDLCHTFSLSERIDSLQIDILSFEQLEKESIGAMLVFCNVTNKIYKHMDTAVVFTQEYSRVSYPLGDVSTLPTDSGCPRTHTLV